MLVSWFSAGVSSAVATKIVLTERKWEKIKIIYIHIEDQQEDTFRFLKDCEEWFKHPIEIMQSPLKTVNNALKAAGRANGGAFASCTGLLKKRVRLEWQRENDKGVHTYIWGMDLEEKHREERIRLSMPWHDHLFPLIEHNIDKKTAHGILEKAGIKRPYMYELGYPNNNCIGCIKGGIGYWLKIKKDFPEVYEQRCLTEEKIGSTIFKDFSLRDLPTDRKRVKDLKIIVPDCGINCEIE